MKNYCYVRLFLAYGLWTLCFICSSAETEAKASIGTQQGESETNALQRFRMHVVSNKAKAEHAKQPKEEEFDKKDIFLGELGEQQQQQEPPELQALNSLEKGSSNENEDDRNLPADENNTDDDKLSSSEDSNSNENYLFWQDTKSADKKLNLPSQTQLDAAGIDTITSEQLVIKHHNEKQQLILAIQKILPFCPEINGKVILQHWNKLFTTYWTAVVTSNSAAVVSDIQMESNIAASDLKMQLVHCLQRLQNEISTSAERTKEMLPNTNNNEPEPEEEGQNSGRDDDNNKTKDVINSFGIMFLEDFIQPLVKFFDEVTNLTVENVAVNNIE